MRARRATTREGQGRTRARPGLFENLNPRQLEPHSIRPDVLLGLYRPPLPRPSPSHESLAIASSSASFCDPSRAGQPPPEPSGKVPPREVAACNQMCVRERLARRAHPPRPGFWPERPRRPRLLVEVARFLPGRWRCLCGSARSRAVVIAGRRVAHGRYSGAPRRSRWRRALTPRRGRARDDDAPRSRLPSRTSWPRRCQMTPSALISLEISWSPNDLKGARGA
jgi:hypothetical protein